MGSGALLTERNVVKYSYPQDVLSVAKRIDREMMRFATLSTSCSHGHNMQDGDEPTKKSGHEGRFSEQQRYSLFEGVSNTDQG